MDIEDNDQNQNVDDQQESGYVSDYEYEDGAEDDVYDFGAASLAKSAPLANHNNITHIDTPEISAEINHALHKINVVFKNKDKFIKGNLEIEYFIYPIINVFVIYEDRFIARLIHNRLMTTCFDKNTLVNDLVAAIDDFKINYKKCCINCYENFPENVVQAVVGPTVCDKELCKFRIDVMKTELSACGTLGSIQYYDIHESAYVQTLKPLQFSTAPIAGRSVYKNEPQGGNDQTLSKAIMSQIASLKTDLPLSWDASIFVCIDEQNSRFMRALIIGAGNTPYQNGAFLFDIFIPNTYPNVPPQVNIINNGGIRFNPNLYSGGKVCLSLLHTWGRKETWTWDKQKSSILEVLVSIQSQVLIATPYNNEPANYETPKDNPASLRYTQNIQGATVSHAIIKAIKNPNDYYPFAEVINKHFQLKEQAIRAQIGGWAKKAIENKDGYVEYASGGITTTKQNLLDFLPQYDAAISAATKKPSAFTPASASAASSSSAASSASSSSAISSVIESMQSLFSSSVKKFSP